MALVDHLKNTERAKTTLAVAFGLHVVEGHLIMSDVVGTSPNHQLRLMQALGEGVWDGAQGVWYEGLNVPETDYKFHPGKLSSGLTDPEQGTPVYFPDDIPHSGTALLELLCPAGVGEADNKKNTPAKAVGMFRTLKSVDYDSSGNEISGSFAYSTNPARCAAHLLLKIGKLPASRIDWTAWTAWKNYCNEQETWDYAANPNVEGIGLYGDYYNVDAANIPPQPWIQSTTPPPEFNQATRVFSRIDAVIDTDLTNGSPGIGVNPEWFLVRWEGKVKPQFSGVYTFYCAHDNGARLWVNGTQLFTTWNQTGGNSSGTITLSAEQLYDIKLEFFEGWGDSLIRLEWEHSSQARQVIPTERLYPKPHLKKRYETHVAFSNPTQLEEALRVILSQSNSLFQDANGKIRFFCIEQLSAPVFAFNESNIVDGTLKFRRRDKRELRNRWQADFRDLEGQYLEKCNPPVVVEREQLQTDLGRVIDGEAIDLQNTTRYQAEKVLNEVVKREVDLDLFAEFEGMSSTFAVLPGDLVSITHTLPNWSNKTFLVLEAADLSGEETAGNRKFTVQEYALDTK
jgi:hypothetical protein